MKVWISAAAWALVAVGCASEDAGNTSDGSGDSADAADAADGADAVDAADSGDGADGADSGAALQDPPLPKWPEVQPGLDDPTARQWFRAGAWYKEDPEELDAQMHGLFAEAAEGPLGDPQGIVAPHAGSKACGKTAAKIWSKIVVPDTVIILAPNHVDIGKRAAIWNAGPWIIPGLAVPTRKDIIDRFLELLPDDLEGDRDAFQHQNAHPSEMQLPYMTRKNPNVNVVFISFFDEEKVEFPDFDEARVERFGHAVATVITELQAKGERVLLIGSADLSHYEPLAEFDPKDAIMMDHLTRFDIPGFRNAVIEGDYTVCAEIALSVFMTAMGELGYSGLDVSFRGNSVALSGEDSAVGYPGGIVWR